MDGRRPGTLADRLAAAEVDAVVGRDVEARRLDELLAPGVGPAVVFVHGVAGVGKTALVRAVTARRRAGCVWLDGGELEPTPEGFAQAVGARLGDRPLPLDRLARALGDAAAGGCVVVDGYDSLLVLDGWLRNELLPRLPAEVTTVLVGRTGPNLAWRTATGWRPLLAELTVGPLDVPGAVALLAGHGIEGTAAERLAAVTRGHPLALVLAASAVERHPDLELDAGPPPEVVERLVEVLCGDLTDDQRDLVDAVSVLRRPTVALLAAVLDVDDGGPAWQSLRDLPLTTVTHEGMRLADPVRDVVAASLELRDPDRARTLRRRAARAAIASADGRPTWATTADLLHLVQHPLVRHAFFPPGGTQHPVEVATPSDRPALHAITTEHLGTASADLLDRWLDAHPADVVVARGLRGGPVSFGAVVERRSLHPSLADDPVVVAWDADLARRPVPAGAAVLLNRWALGATSGDRPSAQVSPMWIDIKRAYLQLRPHLARVYAVVTDWAAMAAVMVPLGFAPVGGPVDVGDRRFQPVALDFGGGSVDGWLARLVETDGDRRAVGGTVGGDAATNADLGPIASLSLREREVLAALAGGLSNRQLADLLFISERTANRHVSNIFTKLGVHNRTAAARLAIEAGLGS